MTRIMMKAWILVTIPYVEVTCHDNSIIQVHNVSIEELESSLVTIRVYIDNKIDILIIVKD